MKKIVFVLWSVFVIVSYLYFLILKGAGKWLK